VIAKINGNNKTGSITISNVKIESSKVYNMGSVGGLVSLDQMNRVEVSNLSMNNSILNNTLIGVN
jgi:hypothetical protein